MSKNFLVKLENVYKTYVLGKVRLTVLKDIDLEIAPGSFVVILGASGSGKSTLLNLVGLLDVPTKGKMFFEGKDVSKLSNDKTAQIRGRKIGFVFQQFNLLPNLNAFENVAIPMLFQGVSDAEGKKRVKSTLKSVGLEDRMFHRPLELSGGEQQRVAIARALVNNPEVIVADEPTGNLDSTTGKKIMDILVDLHKKERKTIIVVTHDPAIAGYGKQIINLKDGRIVKNHLVVKKVLWEK